jgi:hypothetical protein
MDQSGDLLGTLSGIVKSMPAMVGNDAQATGAADRRYGYG